MSTPQRHWRAGRALAVILTGSVVAPLDAMLNVAFPSVTAAFGLETAAIQWLVISYLLAFSSLVMVGGRLGDLFGYRRVFAFGLGIACASFLACGLAPSYGWLLVARVVQGIGIALVLGAGPALALSVYAETERTAVLARYTAAFAIGLAVGPALGGVLVDAFGWRAVFLVRAPLALAALLLLVRVAPPRIHAGRAFDFAGALLLALWTGCLMLAMAAPGALSAVLAVAAAAGGAWFVAREAKAREPTIRVVLFRDPAFAIPNLASAAVHFAGFGVFLLGPYFFVKIGGLSAQGAGLLLALGPAGAVIGSMLAGRLVAAAGARRVAFAGIVLDVAGVVATAFWDAQTGIGAIACVLAIQGIGIGLFQVAYSDIVIAALPVEDRGVASSLTSLTRTFGVVSCAALMAALFGAAERAALERGLDPTAAFMAGFDAAFGVVAGGLVLFVLLTLVRPSVWLRR